LARISAWCWCAGSTAATEAGEKMHEVAATDGEAEMVKVEVWNVE
jgi:hypothetical protein